MKQKQFGYSLIVISLLLQAFIMGSSLAQSSQSTMYIMGGVYPGAPSYTIWVDGSTYYAKDSNGQIDYSGTNASYVINSCFSSADMTTYLTIGEYSLTSPIIMQYNNTWLIGENREATILETVANIDIIKVYPNSGYIENIRIANVWLKGMGAGSTSMGLNVTGKVFYSDFEQITVTANYDGVHFQSVWATRGGRHRISFVHAKNNLRCGLYFIQQEGASLYKIDSHENLYGMYIEDLCQDFVIDCYRADSNTATGITIQGCQGVKILNSAVSASGGYGILVTGGSNNIQYIESYIESSGDVQFAITNSYAYSNYDICIIHSRLNRGEKQGISIFGANSRNNTNIRIESCTIINNGQAANNTYCGIEAYGSGANAATYIYILNNYIGNDQEEPGECYQRGITTIDDSDYFMVMGNDVSTALWTTAITEQIALAGANNIQEHNFGDA